MGWQEFALAAGGLTIVLLAVALARLTWAGKVAEQRADALGTWLERIGHLSHQVSLDAADAPSIIEEGLRQWGFTQPRLLVYDEPAEQWQPYARTGDVAPVEREMATAAETVRAHDGALAVGSDGRRLIACPVVAGPGVVVLVAGPPTSCDEEPARAVVEVFAGQLGASREWRKHPVTARMPSPSRDSGAIDSLTGLASPGGFMSALERRCRSGDGPLALLLVALDGVETVGRDLGWRSGEEVLRIGARRLERCLRSDDELARIDPEVFGVLLGDVADLDAAVAVAQRALGALSGPVAVTGGEVRAHGRVGLVWDSGGGRTEPGRLLPDAREALDRADGGVATCVRLGDSGVPMRSGAPVRSASRVTSSPRG